MTNENGGFKKRLKMHDDMGCQKYLSGKVPEFDADLEVTTVNSCRQYLTS